MGLTGLSQSNGEITSVYIEEIRNSITYKVLVRWLIHIVPLRVEHAHEEDGAESGRVSASRT